MKAIIFYLVLEEPVLVSSMFGDANTETSLNYIPGTTLRGAIIGRSANPTAPNRGFFDGSIRFLNAYPVVERNGKYVRTLPRPLSLKTQKGTDTPVRDLAVDELDDQELKETWTSAKGAFVTLQEGDDDSSGAVGYVNPDSKLNIHMARNRKYGRSLGSAAAKLGEGDDPGAVFRYEAIAPGQQFRAAILCQDDSVSSSIRDILKKGDLFIGGARTAGYGKVRIDEVTELSGDEGRYFDEALMQFTSVPEHNGEEVILTFASDAFLRDEYGQLSADVGRVFGEGVDVISAFIQTTRIGGYNRKWALPLPQDLAIGKGSVIKARVGADRLHAWLQFGIGERTSEGFGRILLDWQAEAEYGSNEGLDALASVQAKAGNAFEEKHAGELLQRIVDRTVRRHWDLGIAVKARKEAEKFSGPGRSQIGRVRAIVQSAMSESPASGRKRISDLVEDIGKRKASRQQWDGSEMRLKDKAEATTPLVQPKKLELGGKTFTASDAEVYEANMRLLDAALAVASKNKVKSSAQAEEDQ